MLHSSLVGCLVFILSSTQQPHGSNVGEISERYKIDGKISIQGSKPSGKCKLFVTFQGSVSLVALLIEFFYNDKSLHFKQT